MSSYESKPLRNITTESEGDKSNIVSASQAEASYQPKLFDAALPRSAVVQPAYVDDKASNVILLSVCALDTIKGIGFKSIKGMFDGGFLRAFLEANDHELVQLWETLPYKSKVPIDNIINQRSKILETGRKTLDKLAQQDTKFLPLGHDNFPQHLLKLVDPPRWIFIKGNSSLLYSNSLIGLVGTREPSITGQRLAYLCAAEMAKRNAVVLSGLAKGIDERAHTGALDNFGQTLAVLGNGIQAPDSAFDRALSDRIVSVNGAVISEYLPSDLPNRQGYLRRNELIATLSQLIIPVECPSLESGTGATIRRALALNTPVAGIVPEETVESSMLATQKNLEKLGIPVFKVMSQNSIEFWRYVAKIVHMHNWTKDPKPSQDRFFDILKQLIAPNMERLELDDQSLDRLAETLKEELREVKRAKTRNN